MHHEPSFRPLSRSIPLSAVIGLLLAAFCLTQITRAQDPYYVSDDGILKVYPLKHTDVQTVVTSIQTFFPDAPSLQFQADVRLNQLIARGRKESIEQLEELLKIIDQASPVSEAQISAFTLSNVPAESAMKTVSMLLSSDRDNDLRMSVDPTSNSIIVSTSSPELLKLVEAKLQLIDQPRPDQAGDKQPGPCEIRVTWLIETKDLEDDDKASTRPLPKSLEKLGKRLIERHGFQDLRTLTSLASTVSPKPQNDGPASFTGNSQIQGSTEAELQAGGEIRLATDDSGRFEIRLQAKMILTNYGSETSPESSLIIPSNHPVAIAVADTAPYRSVLVLEIEELE